jgi:hypothetical protein
LFEKGYIVSIPLTEHAPFDLVIYKDGVFKSVQVKYRSANRHGTLEIRFTSSWADKSGTHIQAVDKSKIDVYCVYCPDTDECYYFDPDEFGKTINLRVRPSKNNQQAGIRLASDYTRVP